MSTNTRPLDEDDKALERPNKKARTESNEKLDNTSAVDNADGEEEGALTTNATPPRASDLYLDTVSPSAAHPIHYSYRLKINRAVLDFDFEKVCSVSLSNINTYGCLVCGKYFQGRGKKSYAYAHAIHDDHHVYINLETAKVCNLTETTLCQDSYHHRCMCCRTDTLFPILL